LFINRNDDSASEDGSEPPSPRGLPGVTAQAAATAVDLDAVVSNAGASQEAGEEEDPMVI